MKKLNRLNILLILKFFKIFIHLYLTKPLNASYLNSKLKKNIKFKL